MKALFIILLFPIIAISQPDILESNFNTYTEFYVDENYFYIGLENGLVVQDKETGDFDYYSTLNSELQSNYINDIKPFKDELLVSTKLGIYRFREGSFERLNVGSCDIREITISGDSLWLFDDKNIYLYTDDVTKSWNLSDELDKDYEIMKIVIKNDYIFISYESSNRYVEYYNPYNDRVFAYALLNTNTSEVRNFLKEGSNFSVQKSHFQFVVNNQLWIGTDNHTNFLFDFEDLTWKKNEVLNNLQDNFLFNKNSLHLDKEGNPWFTIYKQDDSINSRYLSKYEITVDSIVKVIRLSNSSYSSIHTQIINTENGAIVSDLDSLYIYESDSLRSVSFKSLKAKSDDFLIYSDINESYFLANNMIINLENYGLSKYNVEEKNILPYHNLGEYFIDNRLEYISNNVLHKGGRQIKIDSQWTQLSNFGLESTYNNKIFPLSIENEEIIFASDELFRFNNSNLNLIDKFSFDRVHDIEFINSKLFVYGSQEKVPADTYRTPSSFYPGVTVYDIEMNDLKYEIDSEDCFNTFYELSWGQSNPTGDHPKMFEVDNEENFWCLTHNILYKITDNTKCSIVDYVSSPSKVRNELSSLHYSKSTDIMFGRYQNRIYNLNSNTIDTVNVVDKVGSELVFIDKSNDGFVYIATKDGRLFKLISLGEWEQVEIVHGRDRIYTKINNVFYHKDTLYLATDMGLIKSKQQVTSVSTQFDNNGIIIFPNPVKDRLNFNKKVTKKLKVYNILGYEVMEIKPNSVSVDLSFLNTGTYYILDSNGTFITKFIKRY